MKPPPFQYYRPPTVVETVGLLTSLENAMLLAGDQPLMTMLNMRHTQFDHMTDLNRVVGLDHIRKVC